MRNNNAGRQGEYYEGSRGGAGGGAVAAQAPGFVGGGNAAGELVQAAARGGGEILKILANEYRSEWTGRVDEAILGVEREFEYWRDEYNGTHAGEGALWAQRDYDEKWRDLAGKALKKFGGEDEIFREALERRLEERGVQKLRDGLRWRDRQKELWLDSQWDAQVEEFGRFVALNADNPEAIREEMGNLAASAESRFPGQDNRGRMMRLEEVARRAQIDGLIEDGNYVAAEALTYKPGTSIAERRHNPLNLKDYKTGEFAVYADDGEGFRAAWRQLIINQEKHGCATVAAQVTRWAPPNENDLAQYRATLKKFGVDWNARMDARDPAQAAKLMKAMAVAESPLGAAYGPGEIMAMLKGEKVARPGGRGGQTGALSPQVAGAYRAKIKSARERAEKEARDEALFNGARDALLQTATLPYEDRVAATYDYLATIGDPRERAEAARVIDAELKFQKARTDARDAADARGLFEAAAKAQMSPLEAQAMFRKAEGASPRAREQAAKLYLGERKEETIANREALAKALVAVDTGSLQSPEERNAYAFNNNFTVKQWDALLDYGGKMTDVSYSRIYHAAQTIGWKTAEKDVSPMTLYGMVRQELPPGKNPTAADLERVMARLYMQGKKSTGFWGGKTRYYELDEANRQTFLPTIEKDEIPHLSKILERQGKTPSRHNMQVLKKELNGLDNTVAYE